MGNSHPRYLWKLSNPEQRKLWKSVAGRSSLSVGRSFHPPLILWGQTRDSPLNIRCIYLGFDAPVRWDQSCSDPLHFWNPSVKKTNNLLPSSEAVRKPAISGDSFFFRQKQMPKAEHSGLTVSGLGTDLDWIGGFTYSPTQSEAWIEITSAFGRKGSEGLQIVITRDIRNKGDQISPEPVEWSSAEIISYPR
ncbi:MAG: hypothetical protein EBT30_09075 [Verrucomicrobia bacterium]|nr:hypothetical protein [Verrucomicrobiota bacterium]